MKSKYRKTNCSLSLIFTLAMSVTAHGAIFLDDSGGNAEPSSADNGATTIRANGGTDLTPTVTIGSTVEMSGHIGETAVVDISAPNYTVNNDGMLVSTNHTGIFSTNNFTLVNTGRIEGNGAASRGVSTPFASITNSGLIFGDNDAVFFSGNGGGITNTGFISGLVGVSSDGIAGGNDVFIDNDDDGFIRGVNGINVGNGLFLTNDEPATILGDNGSAVKALDGAEILNYGDIQANTAGSGIEVGNGATISNLTTFNPFSPFNATTGGVILGTTAGITAGNQLTFTNENLSDVESFAGNGIFAGDSAFIINEFGAEIEGGLNGIRTGNAANITNHGTITGGTLDGIAAGTGLILNNTGTIETTGDDGVSAGITANITNSGTIRGAYGIYLPNGSGIINNSGTIEATTEIAILVGGGNVTVTNTGLITSTEEAFYGDSGDDTLNLNFGSQVIGDVDGQDGFNVINFNGGLTGTSSASGSSSNSILGDILAINEINKSGSGVAFIGVPGNGGYDVEADTITITGGGLYINGDIVGHTMDAVINAGGAAIGGTGTWDAVLNITAGGFSAGAIPINLTTTPLSAVGLVTITDDVDHAAGTFIRMDIRPDATIINGVNSDLIRQTGAGNSFDVAGAGLRISSTDNNLVIRDGAYTVVESDVAITGADTFSGIGVQFNNNVTGSDTGFQGSEIYNTGTSNTNTVLGNYFSRVELADSNTNLELIVEHDYENLPGLDANQSSLGGALDASVGTGNLLTQDLIAALDNSSLGVVQDTLASLVPNDTMAQSSALVSSNYGLHRRMQNHLSAARSSGGQVIETPASVDAKGGIIPAQTSTTGGGMGNLWGTYSYDWKNASFGDLEGEDESFSAGVDYRVSSNLLLGVLIEASKADYDFDGGSSEVESLRIAAYGTWGGSTGFYSDFLVGYGDHDLDSTRALGGILFGNAGSEASADSLQAMLTVGYNMESGDVKHGPFAGVEYQETSIDGFTTSGAYPIGVDGYDVESLRFLIGYRMQSSFGKFTPFASIAYAHEFEDGDISTTATLPGGESFAVNGGGLDSAILLSIGTGYAISSNLTLNVSYNGEISTGDGIDSHGCSAGLNYSF